MRPLDGKDRQILELLRADARLPLKSLAAKIGLARSTLRDRLSRLEADGIIRGYHADIADGTPSVLAYLFIRLKSTPAPGLVALLRQMPEVRSCTSLTGDIDLLVEIAAPTTDRVNALRDRISSHETVADLTTSVVLDRNI
ncbi:Lrp/AsnC family transcriptional regulator [Dongia deserti]|uniref:Lrp/AsnC family transcriptional regulator n=1 Tax=Dongia deserti TaxID=2268030 RepID=UPI000E65379D|nr:Lrp/AsnC family transcriptional regulator [Dongia deserti]